MGGSGTLDNCPAWARKLLRQSAAADREADGAADAGVRPMGTIHGRADIMRLVHQGDGRGVVVDKALIEAYAGALQDIKSLISDGHVRHVTQQIEIQPRRDRGPLVQVERGEFPLGLVLYPRFEPQIEAKVADQDI